MEHNGYEERSNADYNKEYAIDESRLFRFLQDTQPSQMSKLGVFQSDQKKWQFLNCLQEPEWHDDRLSLEGYTDQSKAHLHH